MADCFVCRKHAGEIVVPGGAVYEDALVYASHMALPADQERVTLPRHPGTPAELLPWRVAEWPDAPRGGPAEIAALCERVRSELRRSQPSA